MLMLGIAHILQQLKDICFKVLSFVVGLTHKLHLKTIGAYLITQVTQYVQLIKLLLVQTWLKISPLLAHYLTIAVLLIKAGLIVVLRKVGQLGLKLQTIALKTLQRVMQVLKLDK
jgi:hypothetical protein